MRERLNDYGLSVLRFFVGAIILMHGVPKLVRFEELVATHPDLFTVGSKMTLMLVIGAEVGCALLLIFGLLTRLAAVPVLITLTAQMFYAVMTEGLPFDEIEGSLLLWAACMCLMLAGPGSPSLDRSIAKGLSGMRSKPGQQRPPAPPVPPSMRSTSNDAITKSEELDMSDWDIPKAM